MRVAIFSDVHGNRFALEAVLADIRDAAPDLILNGGDQVFGGADPAGAWALLRDLGAPAVRGNTEELLCAPPEQAGQLRGYVSWVREQLGADALRALAPLPLTVEAAGGEILLAHGAPDSAWDALMLVEESGVVREARPDELPARVAAWPRARVVVVGHTHRERLAEAAGITFVNVGAVSRANDGNPRARWALLERRGTRQREREGGAWSVSFRRASYDIEAAAAWAVAHAPDGAREAAQLRSGRL
jgi:predicted phosphodiesterase